jgi:putative endonuclease
MVECSDGTLYTGWTVDVEERVETHNSGHGSVYCKHRRPVSLVYQEELPTRSAAQRREYAIKRMSRSRKLKLIEQQAAESE